MFEDFGTYDGVFQSIFDSQYNHSSRSLVKSFMNMKSQLWNRMQTRFFLKNQNQNILKISSNYEVVMLKTLCQITCDMQDFSSNSQKTCQITEWLCWKTLCRSHVICKGFFSMTILWFDKFFDLQSFLMMVVFLLFLFRNAFLWHPVSKDAKKPSTSYLLPL